MSRPADSGPPYDLDRIRADIPLLASLLPMNNCSQAPQTRAAREAAERYLESWNRSGMDWDGWLEEVEAARALFARLVGAEQDEVAVFSSVSHATAAVASALDLLAERRGRNVVALTEAEFPTVAHVWKARERRGTELRWIPVREGRVLAEDVVGSLDQEVLLVSGAHGYYQTGALLDLETAGRAAREAGALFYVDAYQSLGTGPLDVKELQLDFLASGNLKFLMGIPGIAFLYVRRELAEELEPAVTGWFGRADPFAFDPQRLDWAPGARRFDGGTPPVLPAYVARAGMEGLLEVGLEAIGDWTRQLSGRLAEGGRARGLELLGPPDPELRAPTTAFRVARSHEVEEAMRARGVLASARGEAIRLAPHYYNTEADVDRALDSLAEIVEEVGEETRETGGEIGG